MGKEHRCPPQRGRKPPTQAELAAMTPAKRKRVEDTIAKKQEMREKQAAEKAYRKALEHSSDEVRAQAKALEAIKARVEKQRHIRVYDLSPSGRNTRYSLRIDAPIFHAAVVPNCMAKEMKRYKTMPQILTKVLNVTIAQVNEEHPGEEPPHAGGSSRRWWYGASFTCNASSLEVSFITAATKAARAEGKKRKAEARAATAEVKDAKVAKQYAMEAQRVAGGKVGKKDALKQTAKKKKKKKKSGEGEEGGEGNDDGDGDGDGGDDGDDDDGDDDNKPQRALKPEPKCHVDHAHVRAIIDNGDFDDMACMDTGRLHLVTVVWTTLEGVVLHKPVDFRRSIFKKNTGEMDRQRGQQEMKRRLVEEVPEFAAAVAAAANNSRKSAGLDQDALLRSAWERQAALPWLYAFYGHEINARHSLANYIGAKREAARIARIIVPVPGKTLVFIADGGKATPGSHISGVSGSRQAMVLDAIRRRAGPGNAIDFVEHRTSCLHWRSGKRMQNMIGLSRQRRGGRAQQRSSERFRGKFRGLGGEEGDGGGWMGIRLATIELEWE